MTYEKDHQQARFLIAAPVTEERLALRDLFVAMGHRTTLVPDLNACRELIRRQEHALAVVVHNPKRMDGLALLRNLEGPRPSMPVILLAVQGTIEEAVEAMQLGAADFLPAPWSPDVLELAVARVLTSPRSTQSKIASRQDRTSLGLSHNDRYQILTRSPLMEKILAKARSVAPSRATVLIQGESGTGKELLARYIHRHSNRANGPFVAINCAALPATLLESELFGHEKGAFSGAVGRRLGRFELANGGTLLLDEVTEMAMPLQAKLLRVLQEGEIDRLGGQTPVAVDVRIVATSNRDIQAAARAGRFREDLYFRLNVIQLRLPSLREREEDMAYLAEHFRALFAAEYGKGELTFAQEVFDALSSQAWQGNIRELRNIVERGVLLAQGSHITLSDLLGTEGPEPGGGPAEGTSPLDQGNVMNLSDMERKLIQRALTETQGNRTHASRLLGISVRTLRNKLAEYREMGLVL